MNVHNVGVRMQVVGGDKMKAEFVQIGAAGNRALGGISKSAKASSFAMQNAAFQVGDFFTQVAGGQSATRAMAQQLPQLLGSFGLFGALAGAAAAALVPLIGSLFDAGEEAEKTDDVMKALEDSTRAYQEAAKASKVPVEELAKTYGELADEIARARDRTEELARANAAGDLSKAGSLVSGGLVGDGNAFDPGDLQEFGTDIDALFDKVVTLRDLLASPQSIGREGEIEAEIESLEAYIVQVQNLRDEYGITADEAARMVQAAAALDDAGSFSEAGEAADALAQVLVEVFGSVQAVDQALPGVLSSLGEIVNSAGDLNSELGLTAELVADINAALDRVDRANSYIQNSKLIGAYQLYADTRSAAPDVPVVHRSSGGRRGRGSGGGGGTSEAEKERNRLLAESKRLIEGTRTATEEYAASLADLDEMLRLNLIDQETYNRGLDDLKEQLNEIDEESRKTRDSFKDFFQSIIDGSSSAGEALSDLLSSFASRLFSSGFDSLWGALFPNANGNAFAYGEVVPFAKGGVVSRPTYFGMRDRLGLMGESGPEAIMPLSRGPDGKLGVKAAGGGGGVNLTVNIDAKGAVEGTAAQIDKVLRERMPEIIRRSVGAVSDAKRRGVPV